MDVTRRISSCLLKLFSSSDVYFFAIQLSLLISIIQKKQKISGSAKSAIRHCAYAYNLPDMAGSRWKYEVLKVHVFSL